MNYINPHNLRCYGLRGRYCGYVLCPVLIEETGEVRCQVDIVPFIDSNGTTRVGDMIQVGRDDIFVLDQDEAEHFPMVMSNTSVPRDQDLNELLWKGFGE